MGAMAIVAASERGWVSRAARWSERLHLIDAWAASSSGPSSWSTAPSPCISSTLEGRTIRFGCKDDGADIVETALLMQGLIGGAANISTAKAASEPWLCGRIDGLFDAVEWSSAHMPVAAARPITGALESPNHGFARQSRDPRAETSA